MPRRLLTAFLLLSIFILCGCGSRPAPEKLPVSQRETFNLLQKEPQFVMYFNFKAMRNTSFWKQNVSDSLLTSEKTFGSMLNIFKKATGVSVSEGLDELYYSNSWYGENAIVLKGIFNKQKLEDYIASDSTFLKLKLPDGKDLYQKKENNLFFFLKDNITICASNYLSQAQVMNDASDTSQTGLLSNAELIKTIEATIHKNNIWMVSTEAMFIRGLFMNLLGGGLTHKPGDTTGASEPPAGANPNELYKKVLSISFSTEMDNDLKLTVQCRCTSKEDAEQIKKITNGLLTFSKIASAGDKEGQKDDITKNITVNSYEDEVIAEININNGNISQFRKKSVLSAP